MRKPVVQEDCMGCGVACVAYLLDKTYQETLTLFQNPAKAKVAGVSCAEIMSVLLGQGFKYSFSEVMASHNVKLFGPVGSIIFFKSDQYPDGHYVINTEQGWMNPWSNYPGIVPATASFEQRVIGKPQYHLLRVP